MVVLYISSEHDPLTSQRQLKSQLNRYKSVDFRLVINVCIETVTGTLMLIVCIVIFDSQQSFDPVATVVVISYYTAV